MGFHIDGDFKCFESIRNRKSHLNNRQLQQHHGTQIKNHHLPTFCYTFIVSDSSYRIYIYLGLLVCESGVSFANSHNFIDVTGFSALAKSKPVLGKVMACMLCLHIGLMRWCRRVGTLISNATLSCAKIYIGPYGVPKIKIRKFPS